MVPGFRSEVIPNYKVILNNNEGVFISLNNLKNEECKIRLQEAFDNTITIEEYLERFTKIPKTKYNKKKPAVKLIIEEDPDEE
jgi:hypothetical protein